MSNSFAVPMALMAASSSLNAANQRMRADRAQNALDDVVNTEKESMGAIISQKEMFREAASEMAQYLRGRLSKDLTSDIKEIQVSKGLFPFFPASVPDDVLEKAKDKGQKLMDTFLKKIINPDKLSLPTVARDGIENETGDAYFEAGLGSFFIDGLDAEEVKAIAKLGVINAVQYKLNNQREELVGERPATISRQMHRAIDSAFSSAVDRTLKICDELKKPYEKIVITNARDPYAPSAPAAA